MAPKLVGTIKKKSMVGDIRGNPPSRPLPLLLRIAHNPLHLAISGFLLFFYKL